MKPGFKTTEFWFTAIANILGLAFASGMVETGSIWDKILGFGAMALTSMGYSVSRGLAKKS
jgi:hypothetical protein